MEPLTPGQLLALDPDKLLQTHSLSQAVVVGSQLSREVDRKREELRVMVGERYRDLIEAADTIQNMRNSADLVIKSITGMQTSCVHLQHQSAISRLAPKDPLSKSSSPNKPYLGLAASVKLLTVIPERIWSSIECGRLSQATQMFLLAQHVHTGLQADGSGGLTAEKISYWFPVVNSQWATIQHLQTTLLTTASDQLTRQVVSVEESADALISIMLLRNCGLEKVMAEFLRLRQKTVSSVLTDGRTDSAKSAIIELVTCVVTTVNCVHELFVNDKLRNTLEVITCNVATPTLHLLGGEATLGSVGRYLPHPVTQFHPRRANNDLDVTRELIMSGMSKWMDHVRDSARSEAITHLSYVEGVAGVGTVREGLYQTLMVNKLDGVVAECLGREMNVWDEMYRDLLTARVIQMTRDKLGIAAKELELDVMKLCGEGWNGDGYVWTESSNDLVSGGLETKCWGWLPQLQEICTVFDSKLGDVWESVTSYTNGDNIDGEPFDRFGDAGDIVEKLSSNTAEVVEKIVTEVRDQLDGNIEGGLVLAKVLQALLPLGTNLETCLRGEEGARHLSRVGQVCGHLSKVSKMLDAECRNHFCVWLDSQIVTFTSSLSSVRSGDMLSSLPTWDHVSIREIGDSDQEVNSVIQIPASPSLPLITALLSLTTSIHKIHPTSFPHNILLPVRTRLVQVIVNHYQCLALEKITQNFALQLSFDLRLVSILLVSRQDKEILGPNISTTIDLLESHIDPFDLSVFSSHLTSRVKWSGARSVSGLGPLVPPDRVAIVASYKPTSGQQTDGHNVLRLAGGTTKSCPRLQLLPLPTKPVISVSSHRHLPATPIDNNRDQIKKTATKQNRSKSPTQQSATSFFGSFFGNNS